MKEGMARISPLDFVGTRTRAQRLADGSMIDSWVEKIYGSRVELETCSLLQFKVGEKFRFELHGKKMSAHFDATLVQIHSSVSNSNRGHAQTQGANALAVEPQFWTLVFAIEGSFRYVNSVQAFRTRTTGTGVTLFYEGKTTSGEVVDVGPFGFGCHLPEDLLPGTLIGFEIQSPVGSINGHATVKNCRKLAEGGFRVGAHIEKLGRLDLPRWERYVTEH